MKILYHHLNVIKCEKRKGQVLLQGYKKKKEKAGSLSVLTNLTLKVRGVKRSKEVGGGHRLNPIPIRNGDEGASELRRYSSFFGLKRTDGDAGGWGEGKGVKAVGGNISQTFYCRKVDEQDGAEKSQEVVVSVPLT